MTEPTDDIEFAQMPDEEGVVYLINVGPGHTKRMAQTLAERFDELLDEAEYLVLVSKELAEGSIQVGKLTEEELDTIDIDSVSKERLKEVMSDG